jgi:hypothetical protein
MLWYAARGAGLAALLALMVREVAGARRTVAPCPALTLRLEQP